MKPERIGQPRRAKQIARVVVVGEEREVTRGSGDSKGAKKSEKVGIPPLSSAIMVAFSTVCASLIFHDGVHCCGLVLMAVSAGRALR